MAFENDLKKLLNGETIELPEYLFNNLNQKPKTLTFKSSPVLVVEGIFVFSDSRIFNLMDLRIFIDARETIKLRRRIDRDAKERGYDMNDVLYRYEHHITPAFEKYILPHKNLADLVINNNDNIIEASGMLINFIRVKLNN